MRDIVIPDFVVYISMALALVGMFGLIFSGLITDWLIAREDRKKKAAEAGAKSG